MSLFFLFFFFLVVHLSLRHLPTTATTSAHARKRAVKRDSTPREKHAISRSTAAMFRHGDSRASYFYPHFQPSVLQRWSIWLGQSLRVCILREQHFHLKLAGIFIFQKKKMGYKNIYWGIARMKRKKENVKKKLKPKSPSTFFRECRKSKKAKAWMQALLPSSSNLCGSANKKHHIRKYDREGDSV